MVSNLFAHVQSIAQKFPENYQWTYSELVKHFPEDLQVRVEVLNGRLLISESPDVLHQQICGNLLLTLRKYVKEKALGTCLIGLFDIVLKENNVLNPDAFFVSVARKYILDGKKANGAPDLVVEVWSPGNKKKERNEKREVYASNGVTEFWEIYPKKEQVIVQVLNAKQEYEVFSEAKKVGKVISKVLGGLELSLADIFVME